MPNDEIRNTLMLENNTLNRFKNTAKIFSILVVFIGVMTLLGWMFNVPLFKSILPSFVEMKVNTALCFIFSGLALSLYQWTNLKFSKYKLSIKLLAILVFLVGLLTYLEYILKIDLGIDQILFKDFGRAILTSSPGRMAITTAMIFIFMGINIFFIYSRSKTYEWFVQISSILMLFLGFVSLVGYIFGADQLIFGLNYSTAMAVGTSVSIIMFSLSILFSTSFSIIKIITNENIGGKIFRVIFIIVLTIPIILGWTKLHLVANNLIDNELSVALVAVFNIFFILIYILVLAFFLNRKDENRKYLEKNLSESEEKLKELDKLKDEFLLIATHELKTPLIPIKSQSQILLSGDYGDINKEQRNAIEMIERNEHNLEMLTNDVLDIAKIKSNKLKLNIDNILLVKLADEVVADAENSSAEKHIIISKVFDSEIPIIQADYSRIKQVMGNLLNNAIKFTPESGKISINIRVVGSNVQVAVKDNGIGINLKNIDKLFTPFFQIESSLSRRSRGTGLGLAICKGIINSHGGKIWVESDGENKGSSFIFTLPINN